MCFYYEIKSNFTTQRKESVTYTPVCCINTTHCSVLILNSNAICEKLQHTVTLT